MTTLCAAIAIVCNPDEQKRFTVAALAVTGIPALIEAWRATFWPCAPSGNPQPIQTSSTSSGSTPARSSAFAITCPANVIGDVLLKLPR